MKGTKEAEYFAQRLDKIEEALIEITKSLTTLARIEEKISNHSEDMHRIGCRVDSLEQKLDKLKETVSALDKQVNSNSMVSSATGKVSGWIVAGIIGFIFFLAKTGMTH